MSIQTLKFYDPLYEGIFFKKEHKETRGDVFGGETFSSKRIAESPIELRADISKLINTYEMSRLNFIKQSGLAWLVFPSATYTRFSHSLGTYHIGELAYWGVKIGTSHSNKVLLGNWLNSRKLVDEFLISLLLHDVGHFPFSHILEENKDLKIPSHEELACSFIQGDLDNEMDAIKDSDFNAFYKYIKKTYNKVEKERFLGQSLKELTTAKVDKNALCYLISKNDKYLVDGDSFSKKDLMLLSKLVSGLLDLDRVDHYLRDSYFTGLKLANFNVSFLLEDMFISPNSLSLSEDNIMQAINLLETKRSLTYQMFNNKDNVSYGVMLNYCVSRYIKDNPSKSKEVLFYTDDELLNSLLNSNISEIQEIVYKIKNRQPYTLAKKIHVKKRNFIQRDTVDIEQLTNYLKKFPTPNFLFRLPRKIKDKIGDSVRDLWSIEDGIKFECLSDTKGIIEALAGWEKEESINLWVFTNLDIKDRKVQKIVEEIKKETEGW